MSITQKQNGRVRSGTQGHSVRKNSQGPKKQGKACKKFLINKFVPQEEIVNQPLLLRSP